jgi:hypothetical protein
LSGRSIAGRPAKGGQALLTEPRDAPPREATLYGEQEEKSACE